MTIIIITTCCCCRRLSPAIKYLGKSRISHQKLPREKDTQQMVIADSDGIANLVLKTMTHTDLLRWWWSTLYVHLTLRSFPPFFYYFVTSLTLEEKEEEQGEKKKRRTQKKKRIKSATRKSWTLV